mgnify:FL=1
MDADGDTKIQTNSFKNKTCNKAEFGNTMFVSWQLLFTFWVRWIIQNANGVHRFLLDS